MFEDKEMLIDAIAGKGFKGCVEASEFEGAGLARFTGDQHNPNWEWNKQALNKFTEGELRSLYKQI